MRSRKKRGVKHNSKDLRIGDWENLEAGVADEGDRRWRLYCFQLAGIENKVER